MRWLYRVWPWLPPTRGDVGGILLAVLLIGGLLAFYLWNPFADRPSPGPGPGWHCTNLPGSEPVCVKDISRAAPKPAS